MAESPLDRLKRLAAEKKAAPVAQPVAQVSEVVETAEAATGEAGASVGIEETKVAILSMQIAAADEQVKQEIAIANEQAKVLAEPVPTSDHPLAMQFAELEQALLAKLPEFKTILRDIHRHLGQEPELVTQMSEQEIQMVVSGLVVFANAEIVEPAAQKSAKAKIKEASKKVISADDL